MTADANPLTSRADRAVPEPPSTPMAQFRAWVNAFERLGFEVQPLLVAAGLSRPALDDPDTLIPCAACAAMFAHANAIRPLTNLWARLAMETPMSAFPLLDYLVHTSDNVGEGFKQLARYLHLVAAPLSFDIREDEDPVRVVQLMEPWTTPPSAEYGVVLNARRFREETGNRVRFAYASFIHQPEDVSDLEWRLECSVRPLAAWSGLALSRDAWRTPLVRRDPILRQVLEGQAEAVVSAPTAPCEVVVDVRRALSIRLPRGETDIDHVARDLGVSTRTLQRRLFSAGISFQELLDAVRREAAEKCIADGVLSIGEVAYLVGYSEPAAFHRAFRRWTGVTPQAFRRRSLAAPAVRAHNRRPEEVS